MAAELFAIADLHLAFSLPEKRMGLRWGKWENYEKRIEEAWRSKVSPKDVVLIPGDISWAMRLEEAKADFAWIDSLPGTKILLKGNHDYWWPSNKKLSEFLPPSCQFIANGSALQLGNLSIAGTKLTNSSTIPYASIGENSPPVDEELFQRELLRLERSLSQLPKETLRVAMTHYPPIPTTKIPTNPSQLFEKYEVQHVLFGHIHGLTLADPFGILNGVHYHLVSADFIDFSPKWICSFDREPRA